jgi:hypothetical protein
MKKQKLTLVKKGFSKKVLTAILYPSQVPIGIWAGYKFAVGQYLFGSILTFITMIMEFFAVVTWMDAQTEEIICKKTK